MTERLLSAAVVVALGIWAEARAEDATVVFVCEHGSAKSLIAAQWFNRLARERNLRVRAVSRGVTPDPALPPWVEPALRGDGFEVGGFTPQRLAKEDLAGARYVVAIGADSPLLAQPGAARVERWNDIPPASEPYAASRDRMRERIQELLAKLASPSSPAP